MTVSGNSLDWQQEGSGIAELFGEAENSAQPHPGDLRRGVIVAVSRDGIAIDLGAKQQGWVPQADLEKVAPGDREALQEGEEVLVYVTGASEPAGPVQLSLHLAQKEQDWLLAEELRRTDAAWDGRVNSYNKGGLVVSFGHIRGFVPASQVTGISRDMAGEERLSRLAQYVGQQLAFKVVDVDRRQRRLVLSERLGRAAQRTRQQEKVLAELRRGDTCHGRIRALTEYGAFLDLGGMVGLIHRTELAWFRVEHPCEVVHEGQEVDAYVLRVHRERGRLSLSLKRTYPDPWATVLERYQLDQLVEGRVIRRTGAGLFFFLDDGILGFVSATDASQSGYAPEELEIGQRVLARLVRIDGARRRLGVSLRRIRPEEHAEWRSRNPLPAPVVEEAVAAEAPAPLGPAAAEAAAPEELVEAEPAIAEATAPEGPLAVETAAPEELVEAEPAGPAIAEATAPEGPLAAETAAPEGQAEAEPAPPEGPAVEEPAAPEGPTTGEA
jgi:small subunit ribosomal protein S1